MDANSGAWARSPARRLMGAHVGERTRSIAGRGFKAETPTMNCSEQEAFDDDSRQRDEERRRMDAHACRHMEKHPAHGHELQRIIHMGAHASERTRSSRSGLQSRDATLASV